MDWMDWQWDAIFPSAVGSIIAMCLGLLVKVLWKWAGNRKKPLLQYLEERTLNLREIILFSGAGLLFYLMEPVLAIYDPVIWYDITITFFRFLIALFIFFFAMALTRIAFSRLEEKDWKSLMMAIIQIVVIIAVLTGIVGYLKRERDAPPASSPPMLPPPAPSTPPVISPPLPPW